MLFTDADRNLLNSAPYQPELEPYYDVMRDCLVWLDERPDNLTLDGADIVAFIRAARGYIHRNADLSEHSTGEMLQRVWKEAQEEIPSWPGFKRLKISKEDLAFFEKEREAFMSGEEL